MMVSPRGVTMNRQKSSSRLVRLLVFLAFSTCIGAQQTASNLAPIRQYIASSWDTLTRSMTDCASIVDPKIKAHPVLYVPAGFAVPPAVEKLHTACDVDIEHLPKGIQQLGEIDTTAIHPHGLLYLPNKYVVPGGRFNEMYGWDSYFIIVGLLRDGRIELARGMVENFFFEIEHYGAILNANRTYYLSRSQPPFLSSMVLAVYEAEKQKGITDTQFLAKAYPYLAKEYSMWMREPHLIPSTGLARYYDFGDGPPAEGLQDEAGLYRNVVSYFAVHPDQADHYLVEQKKDQPSEGQGAKYTIAVCDAATTKARPECEPERTVRLSADFYKGDRSMRESGFDISFRFGAFSSATHHFAPVCLNSLLYKSETDLDRIAVLLGKHDDGKLWRVRAETRRSRMQQYFWDNERGFFFDYDFTTEKKSDYRYLTTYYPLWAGLATPEQAAAVVKNLPVFEQPGGLAMSTENSGGQWDYPYGWAPVQMVAIQGIRRYGFNADADRLTSKFLSTVMENFQREGTIREKYNVVTRGFETAVVAGYQANVIGFGWTNAAFIELLHALPKGSADGLGKTKAAAGSAAP